MALFGATEMQMLNHNEGHRDSGSQFQLEMGKSRGKNGPARMGTR